MNILEFKRFAELRRNYNYLIIDDPEGDGKYKINDIDIDVSTEPQVSVLDIENIQAIVKGYENAYAELHSVWLEEFGSDLNLENDIKSVLSTLKLDSINADLNIADKIKSVLSTLELQPIVVVMGVKDSLAPYLTCLKLLNIEAHVVNNLNMSSRIAMIDLLILLIQKLSVESVELSEIEVLTIFNLVGSELKSKNDILSIIGLVKNLSFTPKKFEEKLKINDIIELLKTAYIEANLKIPSPLESPINLVNPQGLNVNIPYDALITSILSLPWLNEFDIYQKNILKTIAQFSFLELLSFESLSKNTQNTYAKLNVIFPDPDMIFNVQDKEIIYILTSFIYPVTLVYQCYFQNKVKFEAIVKATAWAKLVDYDNDRLLKLDNEDLEELYLVDIN